MTIKSQMIGLLKLHESNDSILKMCFWILSQPEENSSYSLGTNAGELLRIYSIRQINSAKNGIKIPGNIEFIDRLSSIPADCKVGSYVYSTKNNFGLVVWMNEQGKYLGITRLIPSSSKLPSDFDALQSAV